MNSLKATMLQAMQGMRVQSERIDLTSQNISNVDTPGYRRKTVPFEMRHSQMSGPDLVSVGRVRLDRSDLDRIYDPSNPLADDTGHYDGSNVDLMIEIADAREAQRSYEANLKMFEQTRDMSSRLMDLLRN